MIWCGKVLGLMRSLRECIHCGREFENMRSDFCSDDCARESST